MRGIAAQVYEVWSHCRLRTTDVDAVLMLPNIPVVKVDGITKRFTFSTERLEKKREAIKDLLAKMDGKFHTKGGGGASWLVLNIDKDRKKWGEPQDVERLFALAAGLNMAKFINERDEWAILPGGVPYVMFDVEGKLIT